MLKYPLILLLLPLFLCGQEQVSDIKFLGAYNPTYLAGKVGFALVDGKQYLLQENDSLTIYKLEEGSFKYQSTIPNFNEKQQITQSIHPNRSLFEIRGGLYYRFFYGGLQIIDLKEGTIKSQLEYKSEDLEFPRPVEIFHNKLYLSGYFKKHFSYYKIDLTTGNRSIQNIPANRTNLKQVSGKIAGIESSKKVYVYNVETEVDSLIFESQIGVKFLSFSEKDSSYYFIEEGGSLWKIDSELHLMDTNCSISNSENLKSFKVNGDKLIAIYDYILGINRQDKVVVFDVNTCQNDFSFTTEPLEDYVKGIEYVRNEHDDESFSIFGFYGNDPGDDLSRGLYYIIDHNKNVATPINEISSIKSYTPIIFKNAIYCIGTNSSYWVTNQYIIKLDLNTSKITKLEPNPVNTTRFAILGYPDNNELVNATNTNYEDPTIWTLAPNDTFTRIQYLDFLYNLGINIVDKIYPLNERMYFTNNVGIYSVLDDCKIEIAFNDINKLNHYAKDTEIASFQNKIAFAEIDKQRLKINTLNINSNTIDSIFDYDVKYSDGSAIAIGPLLFYNDINHDKLRFFDLRTNTFHINEDLHYISNYGLTKGQNTAIFLQSHQNSIVRTPYLIDIESNEIKKLNIESDGSFTVVAGYDDSFYFVESGYDQMGSRIRLLKKNGELTTIYSGDGYYNYYTNSTHDLDNPVTIIHLLQNYNTSILITNDLKKTSKLAIPNLYGRGAFKNIINTYQDKFIIKTIDSLETNLWFYEAFQPILEIKFPQNKTLAYSDLTDSLAIFLFYSKDSTATLIKYDYQNHKRTVIENIEGYCGNYWSLQGTPINKRDYLLNLSCETGIEPWILNINEGSLKLLADLNPGSQSSDPGNFTKFKDWIYFTATIKDKSRQWFRIPTRFNTKVIDLVESKIQTLTIFPSPASQTISMDEDLEYVSIYSMVGQLVLRVDNYTRNQSVNIGHLENGLYMVNAKNKENKVVLGRFIKVD